MYTATVFYHINFKPGLKKTSILLYVCWPSLETYNVASFSSNKYKCLIGPAMSQFKLPLTLSITRYTSLVLFENVKSSSNKYFDK